MPQQAPSIDPPTDHETAPLLSPPAISATPTSPPPSAQKPPEYLTPSTPSVRRVRFDSPPPSIRTQTDTESILPPYAAANKYGKFGSEDKYLTALKAWAEEKMYIEPGDTSLEGFYGKMTIQDYIDRPGGGFRSKPKKERREDRERKSEVVDGPGNGEYEVRRRKGSLSRLLGRKRSESRTG